MNNAALHTSGLSIGYLQKGSLTKVLHSEMNHVLNSGEITCLLGPNGSGKSTLIRTLAGFQKALTGEIILGDQNLAEISAGERAKKLSVVLTDEVFTGNMSVFDMVAFGRTPYTGFMGRLGAKDRQIVEQSLHETGIQHLHDRLFPELSDGEKQKVMIAKSLSQQTPVILLDEPTAYLDFPSKVEVLQLLRNAAWIHNRAVLLSTHDLNLALRFADQIWLMGKHDMMKTGIPEDLVLDGQINTFFDRESTSFDIDTGDFEFKTEVKGEIAITGGSQKIKWLSRALTRKGYTLTSHEQTSINISVVSNNFRVEMAGEKQIFQRIAQVLNFLENKNPGKTITGAQ